MTRHSTTLSFIAAIVALNYFTFRTELFTDEFQANHPDGCGRHSVCNSTLNWETFDKDNAPQAFVFRVDIRIDRLFSLKDRLVEDVCDPQPFHRVRDKSPPQVSHSS